MPCSIASIVTELMTPLMPGAGPPPTTRASLPGIATMAMDFPLNLRGEGAGQGLLLVYGTRGQGTITASLPRERGEIDWFLPCSRGRLAVMVFLGFYLFPPELALFLAAI